jgi:GT2 family glycosyltransferase
MVMGCLVHSSTVMLTRDRVRKVGQFDLALSGTGEDYDFYLRTCREGPVGFVDVSAIVYQTGMPDRLSQSALKIAQNALGTVEGALRRHRDRVRLPGRLIRARLAGLHQWVGDQLLRRGRRAEARRHLLRSLRYRPFQYRTWGHLARAAMPARLGDRLHAAWLRRKGLPPLRAAAPAPH